MKPSTILGFPWWPPFNVIRGTTVEGNLVNKIVRSIDGHVYHANTTSKIKNPLIIGRDPVWSLDFQQLKSGGAAGYAQHYFHIENIAIDERSSYCTEQELAIVFETNMYWDWNWTPHLGRCTEIILSLRIGGYLVDAWYIPRGGLHDAGKAYRYRIHSQSDMTKLNPKIEVSLSVGESFRKKVQDDQVINFSLSTSHITTAHNMILNSPTPITSERYQDKHKTLLLDWARCKYENTSILNSKF